MLSSRALASNSALIALALTATATAAHATVVDQNFSESVFADTHGSSTGFAWAADGSNRLFVTHKDGPVRIVKNGALLPTPFVTETPYTGSECGVIGIAFDPNFIQNGFVYLFVTVSASQQQIVRYRASGDVGIERTPIVTGLPTLGFNHDGGALGFGPDGKLYWAIGDLGNGTGVGDDLMSLAAKIGRANRDGTVPADNPFADGAGPNNDYIWARGFRNPFTMRFRPGTGELWVNVAGTLYEQIFVVPAGGHAGWNQYENTQPAGFLTPIVVYRTNGADAYGLVSATRSGGVATFDTTAPHGFRRGGGVTIAGVSDASFNGFWYISGVPSASRFTISQGGPNASASGGTATRDNIGGAVTGGDFWDSTAVPDHNDFFFTDYNSGVLERVDLQSDGSVRLVGDLAQEGTSLTDAAVGPDGALYVLAFGGTIKRLTFNNIDALQWLVVTPLHVQMDEGGRAAVNVRLATAPAGTVSVSLARTGGDTDVSIVGSGALTFNASNWSVPQTVVLAAGSDPDTNPDSAVVTVSSPGLGNVLVEVRATDLTVAAAKAVPATTATGKVLLALALLGAGGALAGRSSRAGQRRARS